MSPVLKGVNHAFCGQRLDVARGLVPDFFVFALFSYLRQDVRFDQLMEYLADEPDGNLQQPGNLRGIERRFTLAEPLNDQPGDEQRKQPLVRVTDGQAVLLEFVGVDVLDGEGDFRPEQKDKPARLKPYQE